MQIILLIRFSNCLIGCLVWLFDRFVGWLVGLIGCYCPVGCLFAYLHAWPICLVQGFVHLESPLYPDEGDDDLRAIPRTVHTRLEYINNFVPRLCIKSSY